MRPGPIVPLAACALAALLTGGCKRKEPAAGGGSGAASAGSATASAAAACAGARPHGPLAWFEDDYPAALACAQATQRPLVIDMWAPWCHTCLSMKTTVLEDPSLGPLAERFVFVALDTDREVNARAVARFPPQSWPTFFVVSPADETVHERWLGAASIGQFRTLLEHGEAAYLASRDGGTLDPLMAQLRAGNQAATRKDWPAATAAWRELLASAPTTWPRRPDVLVSLISAQWKAGDVPACIDIALAHGDETGSTASATDFLVWALTCAGDEDANPARARAVREQAVARLTALVDDAGAPLSVDDRSDAMMNLRMALDALGDKDGARALAERQLAYLADAAARAPDAWARSTFNWPRAEVHVWLGRGLELVPALEQSAADLPREYDPPHRLAWVLLKSGEPARAAPWAAQAVERAYGARKVRVVGLQLEVAQALGDRAAERAARATLVATLEGLPPEQAQPETLARARAELAAMDAGAAAPAPAPAP